ncbi:MAG: hypothetical protein ACXWAS_04175 [Methylobacter sp.]
MCVLVLGGGAGIVATNSGELIAEVLLALEMGASAEDLALTVKRSNPSRILRIFG